MTAALAIETTSSQKSLHAELVESHGALVKKVAHRVLRRLPAGQISVELDDLVHIGVLGLFEAHWKYDPEAGQSFESFAEFRIRGAMLDELRKRDFFPRRLRAKANKIQRAQRKLSKEIGRDPTTEEMAREMNMSVEQFLKIRRETRPYSFVDQSDPTIQLRDTQQSPFDAVSQVERHQLLAQALLKLTAREQLILDLYFNQDFAQREIAQMLELTEGRISQIKSASLKKLRGLLQELS